MTGLTIEELMQLAKDSGVDLKQVAREREKRIDDLIEKELMEIKQIENLNSSELQWLMMPSKEKIKHLNNQSWRITAEIQELKKKAYYSPKDEWLYEMMIEDLEDWKRSVQKDLNRELYREMPIEGIGGLEIDKAKQVPIDRLMEFNKAGFAKCIWHQEKSASLKWYKNNNEVHCFGCQQHGDSIDVCQKVNNFEFLEAVKYLIKL